MSKQLFEIEFPNKIKVTVCDTGVSVWDQTQGRWIIDASTIATDSLFRVAGEIFQKRKELWQWTEFPAHYPKAKTRKARKKK